MSVSDWSQVCLNSPAPSGPKSHSEYELDFGWSQTSQQPPNLTQIERNDHTLNEINTTFIPRFTPSPLQRPDQIGEQSQSQSQSQSPALYSVDLTPFEAAVVGYSYNAYPNGLANVPSFDEYAVQPTQTVAHPCNYYPNQQQGASYPAQQSQTPEPHGFVWRGPLNLRAKAIELLQCPKDQTLPKPLVSFFIRTVFLPPKTRGKGSRKGAKGHVCLWDSCGKTTLRRDHMVDHIHTHGDVRPYPCEDCGRAFTRTADLKRHTKAGCPLQLTDELSSGSSNSSSDSNETTTPQFQSQSQYESSYYQIEVWESIMVIAILFGLLCQGVG